MSARELAQPQRRGWVHSTAVTQGFRTTALLGDYLKRRVEITTTREESKAIRRFLTRFNNLAAEVAHHNIYASMPGVAERPKTEIKATRGMTSTNAAIFAIWDSGVGPSPGQPILVVPMTPPLEKLLREVSVVSINLYVEKQSAGTDDNERGGFPMLAQPVVLQRRQTTF